MTTTESTPPLDKKLNLGLKLREELEITCGDHRCTITLRSYHGGYADLEIVAPMAFVFLRSGAKEKHVAAARKGGRR